MLYNQHVFDWYYSGRMEWLYRWALKPALARQAIRDHRRRYRTQ